MFSKDNLDTKDNAQIDTIVTKQLIGKRFEVRSSQTSRRQNIKNFAKNSSINIINSAGFKNKPNQYQKQQLDKNKKVPEKQFVDEKNNKFTLIREKISELQQLWIQNQIPNFYSYYFMEILRKSTTSQKFNLINREIKYIKNQKQHYYLKTIELISARENVYTLIIRFFLDKFTKGHIQDIAVGYINFINSEAQYYSNFQRFGKDRKDKELERIQENEFDEILKHVINYRKLTIKIINVITNWQKFIKFHEYTQPVRFMYDNKDYLIKLITDDIALMENCVFIQKNLFFLMKKQFDKQPLKILYTKLLPQTNQLEQIRKIVRKLQFYKEKTIKYKIVDYNNRAYSKNSYRTKSTRSKQYESERKFQPNLFKNQNQMGTKNIINPEKIKSFLFQMNKIYPIQKNRYEHYATENLKTLKEKDPILESYQQKSNSKIYDFKITQKNTLNKKPNSSYMGSRPFLISNQSNRISFISSLGTSTLFIKQRTHNLKFKYVQISENSVVQFLQELFQKSKSKSESQINHYLKIILSIKESILILISEQNNTVGLAIGTQEKTHFDHTIFNLLELIKLRDIKIMLNEFFKHLISLKRYNQLHHKDHNKYHKKQDDKIQILKNPHIKIKVIFENDKKLKKNIEQLCEQNINLALIYNKSKSNRYQIIDNKVIFKYEIFFHIINEVKIIMTNSQIQDYYKIRALKIIQLNLLNKSIKGYQLYFEGIKQIFQIYHPINDQKKLDFADIQKSVQGNKIQSEVLNIDVLIPIGSTKYEYMGPDEKMVLFEQYIKINNKNTTPLSLIRHENKYKNNILIKKPFIMKILHKSEDIYMFSIKQ